MHYANGRAAKAGDVVRGKGYNIKHEIVGVLVYAVPGATACNAQIATVSRQVNLVEKVYETGEIGLVPSHPASLAVSAHFVTIEYGQLDAFVALDPDTGDVLPLEEPVSQPVSEAAAPDATEAAAPAE
jgi:hypothetical protein